MYHGIAITGKLCLLPGGNELHAPSLSDIPDYDVDLYLTPLPPDYNIDFLDLYLFRTDGSTLDEPCLESTGSSQQPTWKRKLWRASKVYIGPIMLFLAYSFAGAGLFHYLESETELENISKYNRASHQNKKLEYDLGLRITIDL